MPLFGLCLFAHSEIFGTGALKPGRPCWQPSFIQSCLLGLASGGFSGARAKDQTPAIPGMGGVPNRTSYELHLPAELSPGIAVEPQRMLSARSADAWRTPA